MLEQGLVEEAREVFLSDLTPGRPNAHPNNPWALRGLLSCQEAAGDPPEVFRRAPLPTSPACIVSPPPPNVWSSARLLARR